MTHWLMTTGRVLLLLALLGSALPTLAQPVVEQDTPEQTATSSLVYPVPSEEDLLILQVLVDRSVLGQGMIAFAQGSEILIPLGDLAAILDIAIYTDLTSLSANGWIVSEDRTFHLNLRDGYVEISGERTQIDPTTIAVDENDIYVATSVLSTWLPVELNSNLSRMSLTIEPLERLPFQNRQARNSFWSKQTFGSRRIQKQYPLHSMGYRRFSWPIIDFSLGYSANRYQSIPRLTVNGANDFLNHSTKFFLSHTGGETPVSSQRLTLSRADRSGSLLGPLNTTRYEFGDVFLPGVPLLSGSNAGRGFIVTNNRLGQIRSFNETEVQGDAPPGWDIELYVNGALHSFTTVDDSGRYLFTDIPLIMGQNTFRTVMYGPQGQTRENTERVNIDKQMVRPGELTYSASAIQANTDLFGRHTLPDVHPNDWSTHVELGYGFSNRFSLSTSLAGLAIDGRTRPFGSVIARNALGGLYLNTIYASDFSGGQAFSISGRTKIRGRNLYGEHAVFDLATPSSVTQTGDRLTRRSVVRIGGASDLLGRRNLSYSLKASSQNFSGAVPQRNDVLALQLSTSLRPLQLSNSVLWNQNVTQENSNRTLAGNQIVRTRFHDFTLGSSLAYHLAPEARMESINSSLTWSRHRYFRPRLLFSRSLAANSSNQYSLKLSWLLRKFTLAGSVNYEGSKFSGANLTLTSSLMREPRTGSWSISRAKASNRCAAAVFAYVDLNGNRVFDENDEPLPGIRFLRYTIPQDQGTNEHGTGLLRGIPTNQPSIIELDISTIPDPFLLPVHEGLTVLGHAGSLVELEFPFFYAGEVEGMVVEPGKFANPATHIGLELIDEYGEQVRAVVSEFDGYYFFEKVEPGEYRIRVIDSTIRNKKFKAPESVSVFVPADGGFVYGPTITLELRDGQAIPEDVIAQTTPDTSEIPDEPVATAEESVEIATGPVETTPTVPTEQQVPVTPVPETPVEIDGVGTTPVTPVTGARISDVARGDSRRTLSLIYEMLFKSSLFPPVEKGGE